ncbi:hypothetical protein H4R33_005511 [Dimargaris cristalligena]|nr:hypothetical protein H4R33_005511 [Dimargaris cristalligena]
MTVKITKVDSKYPDALRFKGGIVKEIFPVVLFMTLFATMVVCVSLYTEKDMSLNAIAITVLSTVVSLLISLRTNSAYDRFWEARKLWSQLTFNIRNLSRNIWVLVSETKTSEDGCYHLERQLKRATAGMLVAFCYAVKDHLAEAPLSNDKICLFMQHVPGFIDQINRRGAKRAGADAYHLRYLARTSTDGDITSVRARRNTTLPGPGTSPAGYSIKAPSFFSRLGASVKMAGRAHWLHRGQSSTQTIRRKYRFPKPNVPNTIALHFSAYISRLLKKGYIEGPMATNLHNGLNAIVDAFTSLERIQRTPIPLAYSVHLHQSTWIFLLMLPFQLVAPLKWVAVPIVALAAFVLFGTLAIGEQIENPFNGDENDLPLEFFCEVMEHEINGITSVPFAFKTEHWVPITTLINTPDPTAAAKPPPGAATVTGSNASSGGGGGGND